MSAFTGARSQWVAASWAVAGIVKVGVVAALRGHGLGSRLLAFADDTLARRRGGTISACS